MARKCLKMQEAARMRGRELSGRAAPADRKNPYVLATSSRPGARLGAARQVVRPGSGTLGRGEVARREIGSRAAAAAESSERNARAHNHYQFSTRTVPTVQLGSVLSPTTLDEVTTARAVRRRARAWAAFAADLRSNAQSSM